MTHSEKGVNWTGCGCLVLLVLAVASVLTLGALKHHAACEWEKQHNPQSAAEAGCP